MTESKFTITLDASETAQWDEDGSDAASFRRMVRAHALSVRKTEIYSCDGLMLEAIEPERDELEEEPQ